MAVINKAAIQALLDAYEAKILLYITSNNNKEITGAQLKEILDDSNVILEQIKDSYFNLLDEPRTAASVNYENVATPANWNGGVAPATQNLVNDELVQRLVDIEQNNASITVAYVATNGSDTIGEFELGNPLKPFLTISAAANAVPVSNSMVIVAPGTYADGLNISKNNFVLDIRGCIINNIIVLNGLNNTILANSAKVTSSSSAALATISSTNLTVLGGEFVGVGVSAYKNFTSNINAILLNCTFSSNVNTIDSRNFSLINCVVTSTSATLEAVSCIGDVFLSNCKVSGSKNGLIGYATSNIQIDNNCIIEGIEAPIKTSGALTTGERNLYLKNSKLIGGTFGIGLIRETQEVYVQNCEIEAPNAFLMIDTLRTVNKANLIQSCKFLSTTKIVDEISYNGSDTGTLNFVNCSTNLAVVTNAKVTEFNTYLNANL